MTMNEYLKKEFGVVLSGRVKAAVLLFQDKLGKRVRYYWQGDSVTGSDTFRTAYNLHCLSLIEVRTVYTDRQRIVMSDNFEAMSAVKWFDYFRTEYQVA